MRLDGYNMIIEHKTRDKHRNADSLSKRTEFYERQEQMEADGPEIKDGFCFIDKETYDTLPLTRWLDKSGKPIEDHPELPIEHRSKEILKKFRDANGNKAQVQDSEGNAEGKRLKQVETGKVTVGEDLRKLHEKLADDKPLVSESGKDRPEVTILKRGEVKHDGDLMKSRDPESREVVRTLVERIPEEVLRRTTIRNKRVSFMEEIEHLGLDQESGEWPQPGRNGEEDNLSGEREEWDDGSEEIDYEQDSLCTILAEKQMRYHDRNRPFVRDLQPGTS